MKTTNPNEPKVDAAPVHQDAVTDERRRDAMRRMAAYAAPAMLAMLIADKAFSQGSPD